jgi:hypothetical protein
MGAAKWQAQKCQCLGQYNRLLYLLKSFSIAKQL